MIYYLIIFLQIYENYLRYTSLFKKNYSYKIYMFIYKYIDNGFCGARNEICEYEV